jgi:hypothetical protein
VKPGQLRFSEFLRLPVLDADGRRMRVLDVRTSQPAPPDAPTLVGLLCTPDPLVASLGLKRHDMSASLGRRRALAHGRFVPWRQIASIGADAIRLECRYSDLEPLTAASDMGPPATASTGQ